MPRIDTLAPPSNLEAPRKTQNTSDKAAANRNAKGRALPIIRETSSGDVHEPSDPHRSPSREHDAPGTLRGLPKPHAELSTAERGSSKSSLRPSFSSDSLSADSSLDSDDFITIWPNPAGQSRRDSEGLVAADVEANTALSGAGAGDSMVAEALEDLAARPDKTPAPEKITSGYPTALKGKPQPESPFIQSVMQEIKQQLADRGLPFPQNLKRLNFFIDEETDERYVMFNRRDAGSSGKFTWVMRDDGKLFGCKIIRAAELRIDREAPKWAERVQNPQPGVAQKPVTAYTPLQKLEEEIDTMALVGSPMQPSKVFDIDGNIHVLSPLMDGNLKYRLPMPVVMSALGKVATDLQKCDAKRVLHCDVKPENILWKGDGTIALADYGLARPLIGDHTQHAVGGTLGFMSPEALSRRRCGTASDVFSLGVTICEMVTGKPLFAVDPKLPLLKQWEQCETLQKEFSDWHARLRPTPDGDFDD